MSPLLNRRTTLKDALSLLLDADVQAGIVVDRNGAVIGLVTADMIAERMRETAGDGRFGPFAEEVEPSAIGDRAVGVITGAGSSPDAGDGA